MKSRRLFFIFVGLVTLLLLTACSPWVVANQGLNDQWMTLSRDVTIGQTFVADYSGLQAIHLLLAGQSPGNGTLTLHLRSDPSSSVDLAAVKLPIQEIDSPRFYRFDFPSIMNSSDHYYYIYLSIVGNGSIEIGNGLADAYQNGAAYQNHVPIESQLTFRLDYDRLKAAIGILQEAARWLAICLVGLVVLSIPGWALLGLLWQGWESLPWLGKLPLAIGTSMSFYALFMLFTYLLGFQLGKLYVWLAVIIGLLVILWNNKGYLRAIHFKRQSQPANDQPQINIAHFWEDLGLLVILGLIFFSRFWATRGLDQPMWNDSLTHTTITQLISDHQGLYSSWLPYASYQTFSMHFGFPMTAVFLKWFIGITSGQAVLYTGQIHNIFAALALYPLALRLTRGNHMGGVIAVLTAGLLSPMPAFYINWGRYAQLGAQVILPVALWMLWDIIDGTPRDSVRAGWLELPWVKIILTAGVITGMILFEFRMIFIITIFVISLFIGQLVRYVRVSSRLVLKQIWSIFLVGLISIVLFLPWGLRLQHSNLINLAGYSSGVSSLIDLVKQDYLTWRNIRFYVPIGMIIFGALGWIWAFYKKDWAVASLGVWVAGMASVYSLIIVHIPWTQFVQSFAVLISLYLPAGLFIGYLAADVTNWVCRWRPARFAIFTIVILLGLIGAWNQRNIANPGQYALVTRPDTLAMDWIQETMSGNTLFLVEGMHENWVTNIVGTDAGWWIPLLAQRENTIPPQYAIANEVPIEKNYSQKLIELEAMLETDSISSEAGLSLLCEYDISNIYIGQKQGMVGNPDRALFTPADLAASTVFRQIYHQDRVYVYSVEGACESR